MKAAVALGLASAGIPAAVNSQPAQAGQNRAGIGTICRKEIDLVRLPQRLFPLSSIALFVLLFAGLCPAVSADVGEQGDIIAKLSIDLNNDGYNENIEILRTSDIDMRVRLIRGTKNGQIIDLSEQLPFEHLAGLTVYPIMGAMYPHALVIQGAAGAHRSFLNVYYIGEDGRFSKLFECSGDGGASLFGPLAGGGYGIMVCNRLYDTLNRDETKYYHWDGSEFVLVRREIGYHFTGKFVYPRDPETVAAAYVEAAVLGLSESAFTFATLPGMCYNSPARGHIGL